MTEQQVEDKFDAKFYLEDLQTIEQLNSEIAETMEKLSKIYVGVLQDKNHPLYKYCMTMAQHTIISKQHIYDTKGCASLFIKLITEGKMDHWATMDNSEKGDFISNLQL